jgi:hypothetical protein
MTRSFKPGPEAGWALPEKYTHRRAVFLVGRPVRDGRSVESLSPHRFSSGSRRV